MFVLCFSSPQSKPTQRPGHDDQPTFNHQVRAIVLRYNVYAPKTIYVFDDEKGRWTLNDSNLFVTVLSC